MDRTSYPCSDLSFSAIAEGSIPSFSINISDETVRHHTLSKTTTDDVQEDSGVNESQWSIEMVICSFALHLIETSSNLFALLWQLSLRARWLIILAPHKKPVVFRVLISKAPHSMYYRSRTVGAGINGMHISGLIAK